MRALAGAILFVTACGSQERYEIHVRDPSDASIEIETPQGSEVLLPPGSTAEERTVPRTTPPYGTTVLFEASAMRDERGAITMRCDACLDVPLVRLMPPGEGTLTIPAHELPDDLPQLAWTPDALRVRMAYPYYRSYGRTSLGPYLAFRYDLVIPRDTLVEVREKREDVHGVGWLALLIGGALTAGSIALIDDGMHGVASGSSNHALALPVLELVGGILLALPALGLDIAGIACVAAPGGYDVRLGP